ncbi:hypothetical protein J8J14_01460 [Roseomonas sp. SSH11]|uniref:Uncharacterized protein n=1 Tax=Pararoseomonas baculiformis TaxID=2820812 RepID=A0ABS4A8V8_9PROT|nr:hypothetical protein [Pararoseomonas baculiformis]MBP0443432.1 hypothetical protein [Pararoseomonas baculiformis]
MAAPVQPAEPPRLGPVSPEGDSASLIAALLAGSEAELAAELEPAVEAFIGNAVFRYIAEEALVAISVTAIFFVLAFIAPYLPSITWALMAALAVLLWYLVHFARGIISTWPLLRALVLLRGAPVFRFALFVLARYAITMLETKMEEIGRAASFVPRFGLRLARVVYQDDRDRVALALADALSKPVRREILWTAALGLLPMLVVMFGFRSALMWKAGLYGVAHMAWYELLLLPFRGGL